MASNAADSNWSRSVGPADRCRGFTLLELAVLVSVVGVMASIFVPYAGRLREADRRVRCYDNLMRLSAALRDYAAANDHFYPATRADPHRSGYTCFTGADDPAPFSPGTAVQPNDVTASLWLLVRLDLASPKDFVCPSTDDVPDPLTDGTGRSVAARRRGNFGSADHLSYSYACPFSRAPGYRLNDTRPPEFALIADRNPGDSATRAGSDAGPLAQSAGNSPNHGRSGQSALYADGHVEFCFTPYCGRNGDNIYTALSRAAAVPSTRPASTGAGLGSRWADARGVVGPDVGPAWDADSYLVPTRADAARPYPPALAVADAPRRDRRNR